MDSSRFDDVTKALATGQPRRQIVKGLAGSALASVLAWFGMGETAAARCRDVGENCRANADCCERNCIQTDENSRQCACPTGTQLCPGTRRCVGLCTGGQIFNATTCACECPPGTQLCNGTCVNPTCAIQGQQFNPQTCQCQCPSGSQVCQGQNRCVPNCPPGQVLNQTTCTCQCPSGTVPCGGQCVSTTCPSPQFFDPAFCRCCLPPGFATGGTCPTTCCRGCTFDPFSGFRCL